MKKSILVIMALLAFTQFASAMHKKKKAAKKTSGITFVSMHRTACFGRCPDYTIEIHADGTAKYFGYMFTQHQGVYEKKLSNTQVTALFRQFETYRTDTCQDNYVMRVTDVPGIIFNIERNGNMKKINNANFGPPFLRELAKEVDNTANINSTWKKIADTAIR
jgi:hypothetical protein